MRTSESLAGLAPALAAAQAEFGTVVHDAANPHFRSRYATLAAILAAVRPALTAHGLSVLQTVEDADGRVAVTTRLLHTTGEWVEGTVSADPGKAGPQALGSVVTYLRRYSLASLVGVASADEDDDGEAAERPQRGQREQRKPARESREHDTSWEADRASYCAELGRIGVPYETLAAYMEEHGRGRPSQWDRARRLKSIEWLRGDGAAAVALWDVERTGGREPGEEG